MFYVYILKSGKTRKLYTGTTDNLKKRMDEHNSLTHVYPNAYTKRFLPWRLVYFEGYAHSQDASDREKKLKQFGKVYSQLKRRIRRSLQS